jgi:hypothetical protein
MQIAGKTSGNRLAAQAERRSGTFGFLPYTILYAIEAPDASRIKFGITSNIDKRFRQLCGSSPVKLRLMGHMWMPVNAEAYTFEHLKADRVHGEWFLRTEAVISVATLIAGKRDIELAEMIGLPNRQPYRSPARDAQTAALMRSIWLEGK